MAHDFQVVVDSADPHVLAGWWAETLGWSVEPTDEDFVREIARKHPDYGLMRIQKELRKPEYGSRELNPVQLYVLLRKLGLDTREGRQAFSKTGQISPATGS